VRRAFAPPDVLIEIAALAGAFMARIVGTRFLIFAACLSALACAGFRGGWESLPFIGDPPPAPPEYRTPFEAQQRSALELPGLTLGVSINNQLRTNDTQVYLYALPLSVDSREVQTQEVEPGKTKVLLRVVVRDEGFVFRPRLAVLSVAGTSVSGLAGFEFGMWDQEGNRVTTGGTWAYRRIADEYRLGTGMTFYLSVDFPMPVPSPESPDIALDLAKALQAPGKPPIPLIRFLPVRWKEGYT
jgi:hypothetical protein